MSASRVETTQIVMPNDTNPLGKVSGGRVLHLIDIVAAVAAMRHARRRVVTAAIDEVDFRSSVPVGHILLLDAVVTGVGQTSMEVTVRVRAENPLTGRRRDTTNAHLTFVALDEAGQPTRAPRLIAETDEERLKMQRSGERRARRIARQQGAEDHS